MKASGLESKEESAGESQSHSVGEISDLYSKAT